MAADMECIYLTYDGDQIFSHKDAVPIVQIANLILCLPWL